MQVKGTVATSSKDIALRVLEQQRVKAQAAQSAATCPLGAALKTMEFTHGGQAAIITCGVGCKISYEVKSWKSGFVG